MKITCAVEKLKQAVALAEKMTGKNMTLPVLSAVFLQAKGSSLMIRATNLNVGIEIEIPAAVSEEGEVVVKGDILSNVCSSIGSSVDITLSLEHENLLLQSAKVKTLIKALPGEEFPTLPIVEGEYFDIKKTILEEGIRSVYFAAATTEIKPEIASIYMYSDSGTLTFVATDSFRLAEKKINCKGLPDISKILIPYKNIADMLRALDLCGDTVRISYSRNQIACSGNGIYFTSRLIDGGFPPYHLIIPKEEITQIVLMKQDLINTLRLSTIFADKFFQVGFTVNPETKQLHIASKNTDIGSADSTVDVVVKGDPIEVVCNLKYFLDVFQALSGDSISISCTTPQKPIVIKSVSDTSFLYLLMPTNR